MTNAAASPAKSVTPTPATPRTTTPIAPTTGPATPPAKPVEMYPSVALVKKVVPTADVNNLKKYLPMLLQTMASMGLTSKNQLVGIIATIGTEVANFAPIKEYGDDAYFSKYNGRSDLGNNQPGDGPKFCGRGYIQLTGRYNYTQIGKYYKIDTVSNPSLMLKPDLAAKALCWYWKGLNKGNNPSIPAEKGDWLNTRKAVNGGDNGYDVFIACVKRGLQHFTHGIDPSLATANIDPGGAYGLGCADAGSAGSRSLTGQHNPTTQGDALAYALGLHEGDRMRSHQFEATLQVAADPNMLKIDAQKTVEVKGFGPDLDGTFTTDEIIFYPLDPRGLVATITAFKPDPNAPKPQAFLHDANAGLTPAEPLKPGAIVSPDGWQWPMPANKVNVAGPKCEFGFARQRLHAGIDLGGYGPDDVFAASSGTVEFCSASSGYGNTIDIKHPNGWMTRYAHLASFLVQKGATVTKGQKIGIRGATGGPYAIHLHFETRDPSGKPVDPRTVMPKPGPPMV